jgi:hypothetical protein
MADNKRPEVTKDDRITFDLTGPDKALLQVLFKDCYAIHLEKDFSGSLQGRQVFLVRRWKDQHDELAPRVVKLGQTDELADEYRRYQEYVLERVEEVVGRITGEPVGNDGLGALAYVAKTDDALGQARSLSQLFHEVGSPELINDLLDKLFRRLAPRWYKNKQRVAHVTAPEIKFDDLHGDYFPADLTIELRPDTADALSLDVLPPSPTRYHPPKGPDLAHYRVVKANQLVQFDGLEVVAANP